jgi:hypothetical protein
MPLQDLDGSSSMIYIMLRKLLVRKARLFINEKSEFDFFLVDRWHGGGAGESEIRLDAGGTTEIWLWEPDCV